MNKRLEIQIDCGNAAFFDEGGSSSAHQDDDARRRECAAILKDMVRKLEQGHEDGALHDTNGNKVGSFMFVNARRKNDRNR